MRRDVHMCLKTGRDLHQVAEEYLLAWLEPKEGVQITKKKTHEEDVVCEVASNASETSPSPPSKQPPLKTIESIPKVDVDKLFVWSMFEKEVEDMTPDESKELELVYEGFREISRIQFESGPSRFNPKRLSFDDVSALHRPLIVYIIVETLMFMMGIFLRIKGFERVKASRANGGLAGWYRPARTNQAKDLLPLVFFHGIAPGGLFFYIPLAVYGLASDDRACFLFENRNISCCLGFRAVAEVDTVNGVKEILNRFCPADQPVIVCGHSFGTIPATWLVADPSFCDRVRLLTLLDPAALLVSESYLMSKFLYSEKGMSRGARIVSGSELFTVHYLRRSFWWYNSELWMDELPDSVQVLVSLADRDEILNTKGLQDHIEHFCKPALGDRLKVFHWEDTGHAGVVLSAERWTAIKQAMLQQELAIAQQHNTVVTDNNNCSSEN